jgi:hypothetical protein
MAIDWNRWNPISQAQAAWTLVTNPPKSTPYIGPANPPINMGNNAVISPNALNYVQYNPNGGSVLSATDDRTKKTSGGGGGAGGGAKTTGQSQGQGQGQQQQQSAPSEPDYSQQISELYNPYMNELNNMEGGIRNQYNEDTENYKGQYNTGKQKIQGENTELMQSLDENGRKFGEGVRSALADAVRYYNQVRQQGMSRYGGGSSVGGAVSELANQEFARQQGQIGTQRVQGEQQLMQETTKAKNYITDKYSQLDDWFKEANSKLASNFRDRLQEIAMRKADLESNKTRDKMALLNQTIERARNIQAANEDFKKQLGLFAVQTMAQLQGQNFKVGDIPGVYNQVANANFSGLQGANPAQQVYNRSKNLGEDEFGSLTNPYGA